MHIQSKMVADLKTKQIYTGQDCAYRQMTL